MTETSAATTRQRYNYEPPARLAELPGIGSGPEHTPSTFKQDKPKQGAGWPTAGTRPREQDADHLVHDKASLVRALESAAKGDLIFMPGWAEIDMTGVHKQDVNAPNVTLASDRGPDSEGAKVYISDSKPYREAKGNARHLFNINQPGFRATGFRLIGPQTTHQEWEGYTTNRPLSGLTINADRPEIDNLVGRGWGHAPVSLGRSGWIEKPHVHHCDFVDNPMDALGYGVALRHAKPLFQYCYFDYNRHAIAGSGHHDCSYVARYNLFGPEGILHQVDMHSSSAPDGQGSQAGKRISVHHNEIMFTRNTENDDPQEAIKFRDVPTDGAQVTNNRFYHPSERFDPRALGSNGSAILLDIPDVGDVENTDGDQKPTISTLADAGIEVRDNFSAPGPLSESLGPITLDAPDDGDGV